MKENKGWWRDGGLGAFLFGTWAGWQVYTGLLTAWNVVAAVLLVFFNRVILMCEFDIFGSFECAELTVK